MTIGLKARTPGGVVLFDSTLCIGWRLLETIAVGETESSSKNYTGILPAGYELQVLVVPQNFGGSHTASVSGYVVSWAHFTLTYCGPTYQNNPSTIMVFYR